MLKWHTPVLPEVAFPWKAGTPLSSFPFLQPHHPLPSEFWMVEKIRFLTAEKNQPFYFLIIKNMKKIIQDRKTIIIPPSNPAILFRQSFEWLKFWDLWLQTNQLFSISFQCLTVQKIREIKRRQPKISFLEMKNPFRTLSSGTPAPSINLHFSSFDKSLILSSRSTWAWISWI